MWTSWKFWTVWAVLAGFIGLFAFGFTTDPKKVPSPLIGQEAPNFELVNLWNGQKVDLHQLRGKPIVLNFWASWCMECRSEAHILEAFHQRYGLQNPPQVHVLGVAIQDQADQAQAFARQFKKTYFLGLDNTNGDIALEYGIYGVPETFFISPDGTIRFKQVGGVTAELMQSQIDEMLGNTAPAPTG
jgi:cytochrome c biogenesis protein CcmG/thiol:disulfide interchange protein DsbE